VRSVHPLQRADEWGHHLNGIDWELMLKAIRQLTDCRWVLLYVECWLKAPVQMEDGSLVPA